MYFGKEVVHKTIISLLFAKLVPHAWLGINPPFVKAFQTETKTLVHIVVTEYDLHICKSTHLFTGIKPRSS